LTSVRAPATINLVRTRDLLARVLRYSSPVVYQWPHLPRPGRSALRTIWKPVLLMPITLRSPPPRPPRTRANITARCAVLVRERSDLDPSGSAYEAKSLQLDAALSALWALGPPEAVLA
jgi:hypothetical protein